MYIQNEDMDLILEENELILNSLNDTRIFITGATGFMGSWITETLCHAYRELGVRAHITLMVRAMPKNPCFDVFHYVVKDLRDVNAWSSFGEYDFVLHLANYQNPEPLEAFRVNTQGMDGLLDYFVERCSTFLFMSSGAVYKQTIPETTQENIFLGAPPVPSTARDSYRASKMVCEYMMMQEVIPYKAKMITVRPFTFYGPGLNGNFAILHFIANARLGNNIQVKSKNTLRSYMYPTDLVKWILTIMFRCNQDAKFNIGHPQAYTLEEVANGLASLYKVAVETNPIQQIAPDYVPNVHEASRTFGLSNTISLEEGLRRWKKYQNLYGSF